MFHLGHATNNLGTASTSTKKMVMPQEMDQDQDQEKNKYHVIIIIIIIIIMLSQMIAPNKFIIIIFVHQRKEDYENAFNNETSGRAHQPSKAEKRFFNASREC
jgi:flagellar basal body-associated protein FliL